MAKIGKQSPKRRAAPGTEREDLEKQGIAAFKKHWADALRRARKGKSLAEKMTPYFEGDTISHASLLSMRFFGVGHARKMCRLTTRQIARKLSCYLSRAIEDAMELRPSQREEFIRDFVTGAYVLFASSECIEPEDCDGHCEWLSVQRYPADVAYDDWYERTVGSPVFTCATFLLMKSTGENFSETEVEWLKRAIPKNIDSNQPEALYGFQCEPLKKNRIWIKIYSLERDEYLEGLVEQVARLDAQELSLFVEQMVECLAGSQESVRRNEEEPVREKVKKTLMKRLFGDPNMLSHEEIFRKVEEIVWRKRTTDWEIRPVEDILNRMMQRDVRDYHCEVIG